MAWRPPIVFDHINKTVVAVPTGPASVDKQLHKILAAALGEPPREVVSG